MNEPVVEIIARRGDGSIASRWLLPPGEYRLGYSAAADLCLKERGVSREHAIVIVREKKTLIEDVGSRFGTRLCGQQIEGRVTFSDSQPVQLGDLTLEARPFEDRAIPDLPVATLPENAGFAKPGERPGSHRSSRRLVSIEALDELVGKGKPAERSAFGWPLVTGVVSLVALAVTGSLLWKLDRADKRIDHERARAENARARAEESLKGVRTVAPALALEARRARDAGRLHEALTLMNLSLRLAPDNEEHHLLRAHLLQSQLDLVEAMKEYRTVLAQSPNRRDAKENLALSERLLRENQGAVTLRADLRQKLADALRKQHRDAEAAALSVAMGPLPSAESLADSQESAASTGSEQDQ